MGLAPDARGPSPLDIKCTVRNSTHVVPFKVQFRSGVSLFDQIVYASKKAMVSGQLRPGDTFPSVRSLSKELKINPNTAAKVVAHLVNEGLLEMRPGIGTVVSRLPDSTRGERTHLLGHEIETIVVDAKRLGIGLDDMLDAVSTHWHRLSRDGVDGGNKDGGRGGR
jgi:GntR family transcriptional regulator